MAKLDRIRAFGAELELVDGDFDLARERGADIARQDGIRLVEDSLDSARRLHGRCQRSHRGHRRVAPSAA